MKNILQECIDIVRDIAGHEFLYFNDAVEVKLTPHSPAFSAWGACASPDDQLYVMDRDEVWHQLELEDVNASLVIGSLYQRLRLLWTGYAKAS